MKRLLRPALASLVFGLALALAEHGSGPATWVVVLFACVVLVPALLLFVVMKISGWGLSPGFARTLRTTARFIVVFVLIQVCVLPLGWSLRAGDVREARAYCEEIASRLDAAHVAEGAYPGAIESLLPEREPPRLIRLEHVYAVTSEGYALSFSLNGMLFPHLHRYPSETREWEILD